MRILDDGGKRGVSHHKTALTSAVEAVGEEAEGVGVTLEMHEVVPQLLADSATQLLALALAEERLDGFLAGVTERRIAHIVRQASRAHDGAYLLEQRALQFGMLHLQLPRHVRAQRHAHTCHLQRVSQAVVYEDAARKRKHLRLVLHTAERRREDKAVIVALEFRAVVVAHGMVIFLPKALIGNELLPVHVSFLFIWAQSYK